jgi:hypothetical protein
MRITLKPATPTPPKPTVSELKPGTLFLGHISDDLYVKLDRPVDAATVKGCNVVRLRDGFVCYLDDQTRRDTLTPGNYTLTLEDA